MSRQERDALRAWLEDRLSGCGIPDDAREALARNPELGIQVLLGIQISAVTREIEKAFNTPIRPGESIGDQIRAELEKGVKLAPNPAVEDALAEFNARARGGPD